MTPTLASETCESLQSIALPEPDLTPAEMIRRAEALRPMLRERQAATEAAGNISIETNAELIRNGFYRVAQPRLFGGYEFDLPTYVKVMMAVARGCTDTGWVLALTSGHVFQLAAYDIEAQREAFGSTGELRAPEVTAPPGTAKQVPGGYRVNGTWDYGSGSAHATHLIAGAKLEDSGEMAYLLLDRSQYVIEKNWHVFGMQGTGSDRIVVRDQFIASNRARAMDRPMPDRRYYSNPMYFGPFRPWVICETTAVAVGAAEGALDCYEEAFRSRKVMFPTNAYRYELAEFQMNFGRCRALIETARAALLYTAEQFMEVAKSTYAGQPADSDVERRMCLVMQQSVHLAWEAVDIMFRTGGSSNAKKDAPLGRYWRGLSIIRGHLANQSDSSAINYGRAYFGQPTIGPA